MIYTRLRRHNFPRKLAFKLLCIRGSRRESKRKQRLILLFKRVSFLKNASSLSFSPLSYSGASNLGKIYANFSMEIVTSSAVLDHQGYCLKLLIQGDGRGCTSRTDVQRCSSNILGYEIKQHSVFWGPNLRICHFHI